MFGWQLKQDEESQLDNFLFSRIHKWHVGMFVIEWLRTNCLFSVTGPICAMETLCISLTISCWWREVETASGLLVAVTQSKLWVCWWFFCLVTLCLCLCVGSASSPSLCSQSAITRHTADQKKKGLMCVLLQNTRSDADSPCGGGFVFHRCQVKTSYL